MFQPREVETQASAGSSFVSCLEQSNSFSLNVNWGRVWKACPLAPFWVDSSGLIHPARESRDLWMEFLLPWLRRGQWTKPASCRWICVSVAWQLTAGKNLNPALAAHFRGDETMPGVFICRNNGKSLLCKNSTWRIYLKHAFVQRDINRT